MAIVTTTSQSLTTTSNLAVMASTSSPNTLGLDFDQLNIKDSPLPEEPSASTSSQPPQPTSQEDQSPTTAATETRDKKKPYVNPERVKTGGNQRDKLSEEALTERMARMREQNEKIKQRRMDVKADEDAFKETQESERAKLAQIRKVQENVDRTREQNAKRKMDKIQSREWDSGKPASDWKKPQSKPPAAPFQPGDANEIIVDSVSASNPPSQDSGGWTRGGSPRGGSHRGRGRGKGRGGSTGREGAEEKPADSGLSPPTTSLKVASPAASHETTP